MTFLCISIVNRALDKMRKEVIFMNRRILAVVAVMLVFSCIVASAATPYALGANPTLSFDASAYNVTTVYYYKNGDLNNTPAKYNNKIVQKTEEAGTLVYSEIPMRVTYPSSTSGEDVHYAMRGTMEVQMKESGPIYTTNVAGNYGHMIISCTPSVEINDKKQLSISFLPEICIESGDEATDSIDL